MNNQAVPSATRQIAIALIGGYQKHISPRKGFSCAHRLLHSGESCSQYIKRLIAREGLIAAARASRQRFEACREANSILKSRYYHRGTSVPACHSNTASDRDPDRETKRKQPQKNTGSDPVDCSSGLDCGAIDCGGGDCPTPDCSFGFDCQAVDCGSGLDCGAADCGAVDCCTWG